MTCKIIASPLTVECDNGVIVANIILFKKAATDTVLSYGDQLKSACRTMNKKYSEIQFCESDDKVAFCAVMKH